MLDSTLPVQRRKSLSFIRYGHSITVLLAALRYVSDDQGFRVEEIEGVDWLCEP